MLCHKIRAHFQDFEKSNRHIEWYEYIILNTILMSPFFPAGWKLANPFLALEQMWGYSFVLWSWSFWEAGHL